MPMSTPPSVVDTALAPLTLSDSDKQGLARSKWFVTDARAYAIEHATRPATIGYAVGSSPVALLAW